MKRNEAWKKRVIARYRAEILEIRRNKLIPKSYRSKCFRHRNAKVDHAASFAVSVLWLVAVIFVFMR